jgi:hypothetical protein
MASSASGDAAAIAKEIKTQLKQARELINQKDHNGALKLCEVILSFFFVSYIHVFCYYRQLLKKIKHVIQVGL